MRRQVSQAGGDRKCQGEGPGKQTHHGGALWHLRDRTGGYREGQATDEMLQASLPDPTGHAENLGSLCETRRARRLRTWNKHTRWCFLFLAKGGDHSCSVPGTLMASVRVREGTDE